MTKPTLDDALGEQLRDDGVARAEENADAWWWSCAMAAIKELARRGVEFQAYDLELMGVPPADHANRWGAVIRAAAREGLIHPSSFAPSKRPTTAMSIVRTWRGAG